MIWTSDLGSGRTLGTGFESDQLLPKMLQVLFLNCGHSGRGEEDMKLWVLIVAGVLAQTPALACECVFYASEAEMVEAEINRLDSASVALDGEVISSSTSIFGSTTTAIVRPTHIWFGERLREYRVEGQTNCDLKLHVGEKVRIDLRKILLDTGFIAQFRAKLFGESLRFRSSSCSDFAEAMRSPKMQRAVYARSRKGR
ncbi:hypothetical protein [Sphingobium sp.]|uniref:hypothetical protein n=1 Tax=Sphingobium sp. TaxID=1912891 RepID=UPI0035C66EA6